MPRYLLVQNNTACQVFDSPAANLEQPTLGGDDSSCIVAVADDFDLQFTGNVFPIRLASPIKAQRQAARRAARLLRYREAGLDAELLTVALWERFVEGRPAGVTTTPLQEARDAIKLAEPIEP